MTKKLEKKLMSEDRKNYLRKKKFRKIEILATQIFIVVAFIGIWELLARLGKIDSFITSQPSRIVKTFLNLSSNDLGRHLRITCIETLVGFSLGTIMGVIIAIILWWSSFISKVSEPFLVILNALPKVALGPVIIIWVGAGMPAIIVMALAISLIVTILNILNGLINTDKEKIKMAETFNASKFQILTKNSNTSKYLNIIQHSKSKYRIITSRSNIWRVLSIKRRTRISNCIWRAGI